MDPTSIVGLWTIAIASAFAIRHWLLYRKYKKLYEDIIKPKPTPPKPQPHMSQRAIQARDERERWLIVRSEILLRDHFRCRECNFYKHLEVHHIVPRSKGGSDDPDNLITLCQRCHAKKHGFNNRKRENRRRRHTRRNRRKKFNRFLKKNVRDLPRNIPMQPVEDVKFSRQPDMSPQAVARRQRQYEKWEKNELNQM